MTSPYTLRMLRLVECVGFEITSTCVQPCMTYLQPIMDFRAPRTPHMCAPRLALLAKITMHSACPRKCYYLSLVCLSKHCLMGQSWERGMCKDSRQEQALLPCYRLVRDGIGFWLLCCICPDIGPFWHMIHDVMLQLSTTDMGYGTLAAVDTPDKAS